MKNVLKLTLWKYSINDEWQMFNIYFMKIYLFMRFEYLWNSLINKQKNR